MASTSASSTGPRPQSSEALTGPSSKRLKTRDLPVINDVEYVVDCTELLGIRRIPPLFEDIVLLKSKNEPWEDEKKNSPETTEFLKEDIRLTVLNRHIIFYEAFRDCLKWLTTIRTSSDAFVIHGVSGVGKSCLARSLVFLLSQIYGACIFVEMKSVKNVKTDYVESSFKNISSIMENHQYPLVIDQVNLCSTAVDTSMYLLLGTIFSKVPLFAFSSGHFPPDGSFFVKSPFVTYQVIHLKASFDNIHSKLVAVIDEGLCHALCDMTTVYGLLENALISAAHAKKTTSPQDILFSGFSALKFMTSRAAVSIRESFNFQNLSMSSLGDVHLSPEVVSAFANTVFKMPMEDVDNTDFNMLLQMLEVDSDDNFAHFDREKYRYVIPHKQGIMEYLQIQKPSTKQEHYRELFLDLVKQYFGAAAQHAKGDTFQRMISASCNAQSDDKVQCGLKYCRGRFFHFCEVTEIKDVGSLAELVSINEAHKMDDYYNAFFSFTGSNFPAFDFAYLERTREGIQLMQLIQATVSLPSKNKSKLETIESHLNNYKEMLRSQNIFPIFLIPLTHPEDNLKPKVLPLSQQSVPWKYFPNFYFPTRLVRE